MELVYYPDPRLREISKPILHITDEIRQIAKEMFALMYKTRGVGLAAPQAGVNLRLVVSNMECDPAKKEMERVYLNPRIVASGGAQRSDEACLSIPEISAELTRAQQVTVEFTNLDGQTETTQGVDFAARMFQHEVDHLDGILIIDRMSRAERLKYAPRLKELEVEFKRGKKRARVAHAAAAGL